MRPPLPFNSAPPRLLPHLALPAYRHIPGRTPHPRRSVEGHSARSSEPDCSALSVSNWHRHPCWLYGVDLFNQAFWWEAHEQWESTWHQTKEPDTVHLLKGVIQLGAALIKWNLGNDRGRAGLWRRSCQHLEAIQISPWMGIDVPVLIEISTRFFNDPHQSSTDPITINGPVLQLAMPDVASTC